MACTRARLLTRQQHPGTNRPVHDVEDGVEALVNARLERGLRTYVLGRVFENVHG